MRITLSVILVLCLVFVATSYKLESIKELEKEVNSLDTGVNEEETNTLGKLEDEALDAITDAKKIAEANDEEEEPEVLATKGKTTVTNNGAEATEDKCDPSKAKSKTVTAILALFLGGLGVDRFYIGDFITVYTFNFLLI